MNLKSIKYLSIFLLLAAFAFMDVRAEGGDKKSNTLNKITGSPSYIKFNINRISTWFKNDGESDINPDGNSGFEYPRRSGKTAIFQAGLVWAGRVNGQVRAGGSSYRQGTVPGKILNFGVPAEQLIGEDPNLSNVRNYRVRPDYLTGSVQAEIDDGEGSESEIRAAYERDWMEWPAADGAPFKDVDADGVYNPAVDIPGVPGADQTIWFVCNDTDPNQSLFLAGANPMGIEEQVTVWGYNSAGPLGSMLFRKYKLINKSDTDITDMYVTMWNDPDLGGATDDFVGCDTLLSLSFVYNADPVDDNYGDKPAACGFDFFQGPIVESPGDTAIFDGKFLPGYKNLAMNAHYFYINPDAIYRDPTQGQYQGSLEWYNFMQGRVGTTGDIFPDPFTGGTTTFALYGDPVTGTGWLDGQQHPAGDRRNGLASGPFTMAAGDTQEVVVAEIAAIGQNNINSVTLLKAYDVIAQDAYDKFFVLPSAPTIPVVTATALDQEVVLEWGSDLARVAETESHDKEGFTFQGYNVYQLPDPTATKEEAVRIMTFDVVDGIKSVIDKKVDPISGDEVTYVAQYGSDNGIERSIQLKKDYVTNQPFNNGSRYYFAVTSYAIFNNSGLPDSVQVPNNLENTFIVLTVVPQSPDPGVRYPAAYGDTLSGVVHNGPSDGNMAPMVIDPTKLTGLRYTVKFDTLRVATSDTTDELIVVWHVDRSDGVRVISNATNQNGDEESPIADGIQFRVSGAPNDFKSFLTVSNAEGPIDPPEIGAFAFNSSGFPFLPYNISANYFGTPDELNDRPSDDQQVGDGHFGIHTGSVGTDVTFTHFKDRATRNGGNYPSIIPFDFEIRFTEAGGKGQMAFTTETVVDVPVELWKIGIGTPDDPSDDIRIIPLINDVNENEIFDVDGVDHQISGGDNDPETDWIYFYDVTNQTPGTAGYDAVVASNFVDGIGDEILARITIVNWNGGSVSDTTFPANLNQLLPESGTTFRIESTKPNQPNVDEFTFDAPTVEESSELAADDVNKINVFPNPYYGVNPQEINKYERFVTINHLPDVATIRIFNLAGQLVRTIEKITPGQFQRWDLTTDSGLPVASGLYIIYVDMPDLGRTKILKAAVIQEQQILDRF